ncbi:MAG: YebC/PmpR family DNA-binding transcriptional regulator [Patescibacteria group bacterium]
MEYLPENYVSLSDEESAKLERIIEIIEDDEDVDTVYHNAE